MFKQKLLDKSAELGRTIVFPEGEDERVIRAAYEMVDKKICQPVLIGQPGQIDQTRKTLGLPEPDFRVIDPAYEHERDREQFHAKRKHKGLTLDRAGEAVRHTAFKGALMVDRGEMDACVCGSVFTTGETVRAAIQCIGPKPGIKTISSFFMMVWEHRVLLYSDCAVIPEPTDQQLVDITVASADSWAKLTGEIPQIALLSFSTCGSAEHPSIEPILKALTSLRAHHPGLHVDGELQADAALVPSVAMKKAPKSQVAGKANVLIFPNLHAGNIAYKISQRLAGATAIGPILQGLAKPMNDLSRGCNSEDIVLAAAISALQSTN